MKKILYLFTLILFVLASCDPMEKIYNELDEMDTGYAGEFNYKLVTEDYEAIADLIGDSNVDAADFIESNEAFSTDYSAAEFIPDYIEEIYPGLSTESIGLIGYNHYLDYPDYLSDLESAEKYYVSDDDYASIDGDHQLYRCFVGDDDPDDYIPDFLAANVVDPVEDDIQLVLYKYAEEVSDPSITFQMESSDYQMVVDYVDANIDPIYVGSYGDSETYTGAGAYYSNYDMRADKWEEAVFATSEEAITWGIQNAVLPGKFPNAVPTTDMYYNVACATYDGSAGGDLWFVFECTAGGSTPTFALVDGPSTSYLAYTSTKKSDMGLFYQFDGSEWEFVDDTYYLSSDDYDSMGAPGKYDNFSSSVHNDDYLPQFLATRFPFAQSGDKLAVAYKYYSGGLSTRVDEYIFDTEWEEYDPVVEMESQFIRTASLWVFDPTVIFTMSSGDYQTIVDWIGANVDASWVSSYGNNETYTGAGSYYNNFDGRPGNWDESTFATWSEAIAFGIGSALLPVKFPNAITQVSGIDVFYLVTYATYDGANSTGTMKFKCTKAGPNPEFTFEEMK